MKNNEKNNLENAYIEGVKLHAEAIKKKIDVDHSVAINQTDYTWTNVLHIIELKTDKPEKERSCFIIKTSHNYDKMYFNNVLDAHNPYIMAAMSPDILANIPQWTDELNDSRLTPGMWRNAKQRQKMACPEKGAFTAYKKVFCNDQHNYICELLIPEDAMRSSGFERKCRASKAKVVAIWDLEYVDKHRVMHFIKTRKRVAHSSYDNRFVYRVGETVTPTNGFDTDRFSTCAPGIHFFMTMAEAACY